jgi:hypothetical protein
VKLSKYLKLQNSSSLTQLDLSGPQAGLVRIFQFLKIVPVGLVRLLAELVIVSSNLGDILNSKDSYRTSPTPMRTSSGL